MNEKLFGDTDTGRARTNNEDAFLAVSLQGKPFTLACVIDGVGGYEGGEVAAATARKTILEYLNQTDGQPLALLQESIRRADEAIWLQKEKASQWQQMACVLTVALVDERANSFYYAHVGDTRLYLFRDGNLVKISKDHSFVGFLEDSGRLDEETAMNHPKRNEINKALGFERDAVKKEDYIETGSSPFLPGDMILLCTDGLTDLVPAAEMVRLLQQFPALPDSVRALIQAANEKGGKDNITVVLVRNNKPPGKQRPVLPVAKPATGPQPVTPAAPPKERIAGARKRKPGLLLLLLPALVLAAVAWYYLQERKPARPADARQSLPALLVQQKLDTATGKIVLPDSVFGKQVPVTDTLLAKKDSLQLDGSGMVLINGASFPGPALVLTGTDLVIENLVFENFETAILVVGGTLQMKNVQFRNCKVSVRYQLSFENHQAVSGFIHHNIRPDTSQRSNPTAVRP